MRTNYVLIDYENVQPATLAVLEQDHFKAIVFVGAGQAKLSFEVASAMQRMGDKASYVKISGNGPNALDFHIAFYIGQIAAGEPQAYFHIISKDAGFDPLIAHLKTKKILAARSKDITEIPLIKAINSKTPAERQALILANLQHRGESRPRTIDTLSKTIDSIFHKSLLENELASLLASLADQGYITVTDSKVSYALPAQHC
jgi:hypothetical protein